jgi:hypothetical protein
MEKSQFSKIYIIKKTQKNKKGEKNKMDRVVLAQLQGWADVLAFS